jgi:hypothetical protein
MSSEEREREIHYSKRRRQRLARIKAKDNVYQVVTCLGIRFEKNTDQVRTGLDFS